jgi:hypothetical protein
MSCSCQNKPAKRNVFKTFTLGAAMKRNASRRGVVGLLGFAAAAVAGVFVYRKVKGRLPAGARVKPPAVRPGETIDDIQYIAGGESFLTLPQGSEFRVVWDPMSPNSYVIQDTFSTEIVAQGDGWVRFRQSSHLPTDGVSQVFVIEQDDNNNVLGEHKITVFGPD